MASGGPKRNKAFSPRERVICPLSLKGHTACGIGVLLRLPARLYLQITCTGFRTDPGTTTDQPASRVQLVQIYEN